MIPFSQFFDSWLYDQDGYYANYKEIGKEGDFYTSVSSSMFFGGAIAKEIIKQIETNSLPKDSYIIEFGAHRGYLLADIVQFIYTLKPELLQTLHFAIFEKFPTLQSEQQRYFQDSFGDTIELEHFSDFETMDIKSAFVFANEIFDAFACDIYKDGKKLFVDSDFSLHFQDVQTPLANGEYALGYDLFAKGLFRGIEQVDFVSFDYGEKQKRGDFSLRVYKNHESIPFFSLTPFADEFEQRSLQEFYKCSDLTYDVDFEHLIRSFEEVGFCLHSFTSQAKALVDFGIIELLDMVRIHKGQKAYEEQLQKVKFLIDPAFLGERFKMVRFQKGL